MKKIAMQICKNVFHIFVLPYAKYSLVNGTDNAEFKASSTATLLPRGINIAQHMDAHLYTCVFYIDM